MNGVTVTGNGAVATADIPRHFPFHRVGSRLRLGCVFLLAAATAAAAEEIHGLTFPDSLATGADAGEDGKFVPLVDFLQVAQKTLHVQLFTLGNGAVLGNAVAHMHQAHGRERKAVGKNQCHMQRESVHVRIGHGQFAVGGKSAHLPVGGQMLFIEGDVIQSQAHVRQGGVAAGLYGGAQYGLGEVDHHGW